MCLTVALALLLREDLHVDFGKWIVVFVCNFQLSIGFYQVYFNLGRVVGQEKLL